MEFRSSMGAVPVSENVQTEVVVRSKIRNPETGRSSRTFTFAGVVDVILSTLLKIVDWKGTKNPARFIDEQAISFQPECYALALREVGSSIEEVEYRLITRPDISFCIPTFSWALRKADRKTAVKVFHDKAEAEECLKGYAGAVRQQHIECWLDERNTGDLTREVFEDRCVEWLSQDGKLVQYDYSITSSRLNAAREFIWDCSKRILECRKFNRWLPNAKACYAYGGECAYLPICRAQVEGQHVEDVIADEYIQLGDPHPEIEEPTDSNVLTHSSMKALTLCEVFYGRCYEQGLRKRDSYSEPLWIGSAMHRGVEACSEGGMEAAFSAIDKWAGENPVLGENGHHKREQDVAKARAMVRAAAVKWEL